MAEYKYKNGLSGSKVKGYNNEREFFDINPRENGFTILTKDGKPLFEVDDEKHCDITVYTFGAIMSVQKNYKKENMSRIVTFDNDKTISDASIKGEVVEVIAGGEGMYFRKYDHFSGNRFYYRVVNEKDENVTPPYQIILHEVNEDDGLDRFYCENYRELSRDEFLEEDDEEYTSNLEETAVYLSNGRELFSQSHNSNYGSYGSYGSSSQTQSDIDSSFNAQMIAGAGLSAINPILGSAVMVSASLNKKRREEEMENNNSGPEM